MDNSILLSRFSMDIYKDIKPNVQAIIDNLSKIKTDRQFFERLSRCNLHHINISFL